jgi:hypothetical protein
MLVEVARLTDASVLIRYVLPNDRTGQLTPLWTSWYNRLTQRVMLTTQRTFHPSVGM